MLVLLDYQLAPQLGFPKHSPSAHVSKRAVGPWVNASCWERLRGAAGKPSEVYLHFFSSSKSELTRWKSTRTY